MLPHQYIRLHLFKPLILHCRLQWGVLPTYVQKSTGVPSCNPSVYLVLKSPQGPSHAGGRHPHIRSENKYCLNHYLEEHPRQPRVVPLPSQYFRQLRLSLPCLPLVPRHGRPVIIQGLQDPTNVFEQCYRVQWPSICP